MGVDVIDMAAQSEAILVAAELCRQFEGFRSKPYLCPAGVPTIGYGSTEYADGRMVSLADPPISQTQGDALLMHKLAKVYLPGVLAASPGLIEYPQRMGAIVDFAYNCGVSRYGASTLRQAVDAQGWDEAKRQIMKWTRGGGKVLPGLVRRREAEAALL